MLTKKRIEEIRERAIFATNIPVSKEKESQLFGLVFGDIPALLAHIEGQEELLRPLQGKAAGGRQV